MKKSVNYFLFFVLVLGKTFGQTTTTSPTDSWGDYYFVNKMYPAAISAFEKHQGELTLEQQRNFALAYLFRNKKIEAEKVYAPVANSNQARVSDYYRYANLLVDQKRLAEEYRTKAYKLAWTTPSLVENDSLLFKRRFGTSPYTVSSVNGNSSDNEFGLIFLSEDQKSKVFFLSDQEKTKGQSKALKRLKTDYPIYNFYQANFDIKTMELTNAEGVPSSVNSFFQEGPGSYHQPTDLFYFSRSAQRYDKEKTVHLNSYVIKKSEINQNRMAIALPFNLEGSSTLHPSISPSGDRLFFASDRPGGFGGMDLYYVTIQNGQYSKPINLGPDINTAGDEVFPFAYSDTQLFFSSNGREGIGQLDVFFAEHKIERRWEAFVLGKGINTPKDDFSFGLNEQLSVAYLASDRIGGKGADDLYAFPFTPEISGIDDHYVYVPSDTLIIANNGILKNDIQALNEKDPLQRLIKKEAIQTQPSRNGVVRFHSNGSFLYKSTQPLAVKDSFAYKVKTVKGISEEVWVHLDRAAVDEADLTKELSSAFSPIYYNLDKSNILAEYIDRVEKVVAVMKKYPSLEIEVSSYTDCRASAAYNLALSERRTQSIIDYVRARIEKPERIYGKGYGEQDSFDATLKDYQLIVGAYANPSNVTAMQDRLKILGYPSTTVQVNGAFTRVIVAQSDLLGPLKTTKEALTALEIPSWIAESPCFGISEAAHQENRRTDFKVIRL